MAARAPEQVSSPMVAADTVRGKRASYAVDQLGLPPVSVSPAFNPRVVSDSARARDLEYRESFYRSTHHDQKTYNFNGQFIRPGPPSTQPLLSGGSTPSFYVPLDQRRPNSPYRLPRVIVSRFTALLFGKQRWPAIKVVGDPDTEDFAQALAEASSLRSVMVRGRNMGGSTGTVGFSWRFVDGLPRVLPHAGKHLWVHDWEDRDELAPAHVTKIVRYAKDAFDAKEQKVVRKYFWQRRDWTPVADVAFLDVAEGEEEGGWRIDEDETFIHGDGFCHFVWVQNRPDDDGTEVDGQPDYADLYENFGQLDILNSATSRGTCLNVDPTLVMKIDPAAKASVAKGSGQAIWVGEGGDAKYLELSGTSVTAASSVLDRERGQALEVAQCVTPDPDTLAAAGTSRVALELIYEPMLGEGDVLRVQYGDRGVVPLLNQMIASAKRLEEQDDDVDIEVDDDGNEVEQSVRYELRLPKRVVQTEKTDENGQPTGEHEVEYVERKVGAGGRVELVWPAYFAPTPSDRSASVTTLNTAAGGKPVLSQKSATEIAADLFDLDPDEEWAAVSQAMREEASRNAEMFPGAGGQVAHRDDLPPGAEPTGIHALPKTDPNLVTDLDQPELQLSGVGHHGAPGPGAAPPMFGGPKTVAKTVSKQTPDQIAVLTVNELREQIGVPPLPDPIGSMTVAEFKAHVSAKGQAVGEAVGQEEAKESPGSPVDASSPPEGPNAGAKGPNAQRGVPEGARQAATNSYDAPADPPPEGFGPSGDQ